MHTNGVWQSLRSHQYLYDRWNVIVERIDNQQLVVTREYTWGLDLSGLEGGAWSQDAGVPRHSASGATAGGIGGLLAITEVTGPSTNLYLPVCDQVGTVHALVAAVTNNVAIAEPFVAVRYEYSPYGELFRHVGSGVSPMVLFSTPDWLNGQHKVHDGSFPFWGFLGSPSTPRFIYNEMNRFSLSLEWNTRQEGGRRQQ